MYVAGRVAVRRHVQLGGGGEVVCTARRGGSEVVHAARRAVVRQRMQLGGCSNVTCVAGRGAVMQHLQLGGVW